MSVLTTCGMRVRASKVRVEETKTHFTLKSIHVYHPASNGNDPSPFLRSLFPQVWNLNSSTLTQNDSLKWA